MANKRTKMIALNINMKPEDPAGYLQKAIDEMESQGHYVMQYIAITAYQGVLLAHDYPDKKNVDDDLTKQKKTSEPATVLTDEDEAGKPVAPTPSKPDDDGTPAAVNDPTTREQAKAKKGKRK